MLVWQVSSGSCAWINLLQHSKMTNLWITIIVPIILWTPAFSELQLDCGIGGEAVEGSEHTLTCGGLQAGDTVYWTKRDQHSVTIAVANCTGSGSCQNTYSGKYDVTRASSSSTSRLKILQVTRDLSYIGGDWTCTALSSSTCSITVIFPPDHDGCEVRFDGASGQVLGQCVLHKVFPSPTCTWSEQFQGGQWVQIPNNQTTLTETQFVDASNSRIYFRATCQLHRPLPVTVGSYNYKVQVIPGHVEPVINFTSTNTIRLPASPSLTSSCPSHYVKDASIAKCPCMTSDLGSPPAQLAWIDPDGRSVVSASTLTLTLPFTDVTAGYNGGTYHCEVQHHTGNSRVQYVPNIAVRPNKPTVSGPNNQTSFSTGQTITLQCTADGGRPDITGLVLQCPGQPDAQGRQEGGMMISRQTLTLAVSNDGAFCSCIADNGYVTSDTAVFVLRVSDGATRDGAKESDIIVIGAVVGGLVLLAVVVVLVALVLWMHKQNTKDNPNNTGGSTSYENLREDALADESGFTTGRQGMAPRASCGAGEESSSATTGTRSKENDYSEFPSKSMQGKRSPTREPGGKGSICTKLSTDPDKGCGKPESRHEASQGVLPKGSRKRKNRKRKRNKNTDDLYDNTSVTSLGSDGRCGQKTKNDVATSMTKTLEKSHKDHLESDSDSHDTSDETGDSESSPSSNHGEEASDSEVRHSMSQEGARPSLDYRHEDSRPPNEHCQSGNAEVQENLYASITDSPAPAQIRKKPTPPPRTPGAIEAADNGGEGKPDSFSCARSQEYVTKDSRVDDKEYASGDECAAEFTSGLNYADQSKRTMEQIRPTSTSSSHTAHYRRTGNLKRARKDREEKHENPNEMQIRARSRSQKSLKGNDIASSKMKVSREETRELTNKQDVERGIVTVTTRVGPRELPIPKNRPSSSHDRPQRHGMITNNAAQRPLPRSSWHEGSFIDNQDSGAQPGQVSGSGDPPRSPRTLPQPKSSPFISPPLSI